MFLGQRPPTFAQLAHSLLRETAGNNTPRGASPRGTISSGKAETLIWLFRAKLFEVIRKLLQAVQYGTAPHDFRHSTGLLRVTPDRRTSAANISDGQHGGTFGDALLSHNLIDTF